MDWKTMLAYATGSVDENLLLRIEYLVEGSREFRAKIYAKPLLFSFHIFVARSR
jgi:hypothetical protein